MGLFDWLTGKKTPAAPAEKTKGAPSGNQNATVIRDVRGDIIGLWTPRKGGFIKVEEVVTKEVVIALKARNYRTVPNTHDDRGGVFLMFGDALAPGEQHKPTTAKSRCNRCGKDLAELPTGAMFSGGALMSMLDATTYPCKTCGTVFCIDCMRAIVNDPCPHCGTKPMR